MYIYIYIGKYWLGYTTYIYVYSKWRDMQMYKSMYIPQNESHVSAVWIMCKHLRFRLKFVSICLRVQRPWHRWWDWIEQNTHIQHPNNLRTTLLCMFGAWWQDAWQESEPWRETPLPDCASGFENKKTRKKQGNQIWWLYKSSVCCFKKQCQS